MNMQDAPSLEKLAIHLRALASSATRDLETAVGDYLAGELSSCQSRERLELLEGLCGRFQGEARPAPVAAGESGQDITQLVLHFLGSSSTTSTISPAEMLEKFAGSLDVLFNSLNEIISVINVRLLGQSPELETIRRVIGTNMEKGNDNLPIKEYLDQIQQAFLAAHSSFQVAAVTLLAELLSELDPALLLQAKSSGLKFGALRKAELFEQYQEKHARCRVWLESGQCKESLLREFEKNCRQTFKGSLG